MARECRDSGGGRIGLICLTRDMRGVPGREEARTRVGTGKQKGKEKH